MVNRKKVLTLNQLAEQIEKSNKAFVKMTPAQQRVEIAEDCLARIRVGQFTPDTGATFDKYVKRNNEGNVKDALNNCENPLHCSVCAKGGLFMSYVGRVNTLDFEDLGREHEIYNKDMKFLSQLFEPAQLELMEVVFEGVGIDEWGDNKYRTLVDTSINLSDTELGKIYRKGKSCNTSEKRLTYICKNLIKNKGTFKI